MPSRGRAVRRGLLRVRGQVKVDFTAHGERLYSTAESAGLVRVAPATIRAWRRRPHPFSLGRMVLDAQGLDRLGRPLHTAQAVREAEQVVRESGLLRANGGIDPRVLRGRRAKSPAAVAANAESPRP